MTLMAHGCEYDFRMPYEIRPEKDRALNTGGDLGEMVYWALSIHRMNDVFYSSNGSVLVFEGKYPIGSMGGSYCIGVTLHIQDGAAKGRISVGHGSQDMVAEHELAVANRVLRALESVLLIPAQPPAVISSSSPP